MLVHTCSNKECSQYLIGGVALCKITDSLGRVASLDTIESKYVPEKDEPTGFVLCFHCRGKTSQVEYDPETTKPDQIDRMIEELDLEIESIMKTLGVD